MTFYVSDESELGVPGSLFSGDIRTHMYHGFNTNIVDPTTGCLDPSVLDGKQRGVHSDLGHGQGGFSWTVAEIASKENVWPDAVSTDLHTGMSYTISKTLQLPIINTVESLFPF